MKREFKKGDKVRFRGPYMFSGSKSSGGWAYEPNLCTVSHFDEGTILATPPGGPAIEFRASQVTHRIVPKKRREFYIGIRAVNPSIHHVFIAETIELTNPQVGKEYSEIIHVREVRK